MGDIHFNQEPEAISYSDGVKSVSISSTKATLKDLVKIAEKFMENKNGSKSKPPGVS